MDERVTTTSERVLEFIDRYRGDYECGPTVREIVRAVPIRSTSVAHYHMRGLRDQGLIDWHELGDGTMMARSVWVTAAGRVQCKAQRADRERQVDEAIAEVAQRWAR